MQQNEDWLKLDNAAKLFPSNATKRDTRVFRFACVLNEYIDPPVLQDATNNTLEQFPYYKSIIKKGLFWYYFEESDLKPVVLEEYEPICAPIYDRYQRSLLFKVTYFKKRINLEVFHALSDGAGAVEFLRALVTNYLILKHPKKLSKINIDLEYDASLSDKASNAFDKYYDAHGNKKQSKIPRAHIIKGKKHNENRLQVIEGTAKTSELKKLSKDYDTTITILLTAILMLAVNETMSTKEKNRDVVVTIPVNLRQYFKSLSARNFFGVFNVGYNFKKNNTDLKELITYLNKFFKERLNAEQMSGNINSMMKLEKNLIIRSVPIFIKDIILKIAYQTGDLMSTVALSNVSIIKMPEVFDEYIDFFEVFTSTNKVQICVCSYLDKFAMCFTSPFVDSDIEKNFFRILSALGINIRVSSNIDI